MGKNMSKKQNKTWEGERSGNSQRNRVKYVMNDRVKKRQQSSDGIGLEGQS